MEEKNNEPIEPEVNEDEELDKVLEESIASVQAGKELLNEAEAEEPTGEEEPKAEDGESPEPEVTPEEPEVPNQEETGTPPPAEGEYDFRIPNKGKFESDESFEKRVELMDLVKKRKLAKGEDQKASLTEQINTTKGQIKNLNGTDKLINPLNQKSEAEPSIPEDEDPTLTADKERLRALGGATKEDIQEIIQTERLAAEARSTLETFVGRHSELKDEDTREVFFDFVDSNYNWQNKSGKDLMTVLELAKESMFKPSETITERVLKGADVQNKVNAMQFPGGTVAKTEYSPEMKASLDELMATGLSEEKAIELMTE